MIVIVSKDKDFSQVVAEQARRELALACQIAENIPAKSVLALATLVVTNEDIDASCPVIVVKNPPIRLASLLEDIAAGLQKQPDDTLDLGQGYGLQLRQKQLIHAGNAVDLTDKEVQLVQSLAEAGKKGIAKDQLLKDVWGIEAALDTHTLETHIYRLRGKFKELAGDEMIEAVDGGYRMAEI